MADQENIVTVENAKLYECPNCGFRFDALHENEGGGYTCMLCAETELQDQLQALREAAQDLYDVQNGPPLPSYEAEWQEAMAQIDRLLGREVQHGR